MTEPRKSPAEEIRAWVEEGEKLEWEVFVCAPGNLQEVAAAVRLQIRHTREREPRARRVIEYLMLQLSTEVCGGHDAEEDCAGCEVAVRVAAILRGEP